MPSAPGRALAGYRSRQTPSEAPKACSPANRSPTMAFYTHYYGKKSLHDMPSDIIVAILIEWTKLEWFAPTIARRICRYLKEITDDSPRVWSKLCLPEDSRATANDVREWLNRAKAAPKEIFLETNDFCIAAAALKGAEDATSLIYQTPKLDDISDSQYEQILLPARMPLLRHLRLDIPHPNCPMSLTSISRLYQSPVDAHFPCLTVLHLVYINLTNFPDLPGIFPVLRCLVIRGFRGSCLNLIRVCSESLVDLMVSSSVSGESSSPSSSPSSSQPSSPPSPQPPPQSSPLSPPLSPLHDHIFLPNLEVLLVDSAPGVVSKLEAPALRLIYADLHEIKGPTSSFSSVVEWAARRSPYLEPTSITSHLIHMPKLRHLMLFQHKDTLGPCFEFLRSNPETCPNLQSIEVVDFARNQDFDLDANFKEFLMGCAAKRAEKAHRVFVEFIEQDHQASLLEQHYAIEVCLFIVFHHYFSYHASRNSLTR
jgi:hypothetical protein